MSEFNNDLFLEPKTTQYGSHMIMSNVHRPSKIKYINIDTRFRDEYNSLKTSDYNITLPERIPNIRSIRATNIEIPISYYLISASLGNNCFSIASSSTSTSSSLLTIPDGSYTTSTLKSVFNTAIGQLSSPYKNLQYDYDSSGGSVLNTSTGTLFVNFAISANGKTDTSGQSDKYNLKTKLGWLLGFRQPTYTIATSNTLSEGIIDLNGPRYLYLAIDEHNSKGNQNSFVGPLTNSHIANVNILARVAMDYHSYSFGSILPANQFNGLLISDKRSYTGKIDLLKLNVQLVNEFGMVMNLNGLDFSFCLEIEHE
jgi:hypothetical protein